VLSICDPQGSSAFAATFSNITVVFNEKNCTSLLEVEGESKSVDVNASKLLSNYACTKAGNCVDLQNYLTSNELRNSNDYWTCYGEAINVVCPPAPVPYKLEF